MMRIQVALLCLAILHVPVNAQADWIYDMTSEACSDASRQRIASSVRTQVEDSVRRAEASIAPPTPVGELGCLESLMTLNIGNFAPTSGIRNLFNQSLAQLFDGNGQLARRLCRMAARKWQDATRSLADSGFQPGTANLPSFLSPSPLQPIAPSILQTSSGPIDPITGVRVLRREANSMSGHTTRPEPSRTADGNRQNSDPPASIPDASSADNLAESGNRQVDGIWGSLYRSGVTP